MNGHSFPHLIFSASQTRPNPKSQPVPSNYDTSNNKIKMKFVLVKLSALALVATHTTFAKGEAAIQLRGAIPLVSELLVLSHP